MTQPTSRPSEGVTPDHVQHIARLARLGLAEADIPAVQEKFNAILSFIDRLRDLKEEPAVLASSSQKLSWRPENLDASQAVSPDALLSLAPQREGDFFAVPRVIE